MVREGDARLDQLALKVLIAELLAVGGDTALRRVNRSLDRSDQTAQFLFYLWLSYIVEVRVSESLLAGQPIRWVQLQKADHELKRLLRKGGHVSLLKRFRLIDLWEFETNEARVLIEGLHLFFSQGSKNLLDQVKLVHF